MTSASELFYNRRSRFGRTSDPLDTGSDFGAHPHLDRTNRRHRSNNSPGGNHARRNRLDPDGCDPLRRSRPPPTLHRTSSHVPQEWESTRVEDNEHQFSSGNVSSRDRMRVSGSGNDRLPGAVLLARERLLQRLRGVTLFSARRSNRGLSSGSHSNNTAISDDFRLVDAGDWETEIYRESLATIAPLTNSFDQQTSKRPPGLTEEALSRLCLETFSVVLDESNEQGSSRTIKECSICLESFSEGDELIRLPCGHRNHFCCLEPWVRTCGDCPYCRSGIDENQDC